VSFQADARRSEPRWNARQRADVSITPAFSWGNSFPRFPAPANRDTWSSVRDSRGNGAVSEEGVGLKVGWAEDSGEWETTRSGASL